MAIKLPDNRSTNEGLVTWCWLMPEDEGKQAVAARVAAVSAANSSVAAMEVLVYCTGATAGAVDVSSTGELLCCQRSSSGLVDMAISAGEDETYRDRYR